MKKSKSEVKNGAGNTILDELACGTSWRKWPVSGDRSDIVIEGSGGKLNQAGGVISIKD